MHHPNCLNHDNDGKVTPAQLAAADRRHAAASELLNFMLAALKTLAADITADGEAVASMRIGNTVYDQAMPECGCEGHVLEAMAELCDMLGLAVHRILTADVVVAPRG